MCVAILLRVGVETRWIDRRIISFVFCLLVITKYILFLTEAKNKQKKLLVGKCVEVQDPVKYQRNNLFKTKLKCKCDTAVFY
jgi:hypothetical protein